MSLAALSILAGCTSADKMETLNTLEKNLATLEQERSDARAMIDEYESEISAYKAEITALESDITAIDAFVNPETVFDKNGVIIKKEKDSLTLIMPTDVVFDFNKANVKNEFKPMLETLAEALNVYTSVAVKIDGHTDNVGEYDYNMNLSRKRAESAKAFLVEKGVNEEFSLFAEYDLALNDNTGKSIGDGKGYLNAGLKWSFAGRLFIEFLWKDIAKNNGFNEASSREIRLSYIEYF